MTVLSQIYGKAHDTFHSTLDNDVMEAAKRCLADWLGLAVSGASEELVKILISGAPANVNGSTIIGKPDVKVDPVMAAWINGASSHSMDYDDTNVPHLIHVSSTLFPSLFALAEQYPITGEELLKAFIIGYETEDRIGYYISRKLINRGWHITSILGRFGASLSSAIALKISQQQAENAMAISAISVSGMNASFGTMSKPFQVGRASADGLMASLLAGKGFTGPRNLLEKEYGFTFPLIGENVTNWDHAVEQWGKPYAVFRNCFKPHAACLLTHATIDAAIQIGIDLKKEGIHLDNVSHITCYVHELAPKVAGISDPKEGLEGKFSLKYCCAVAMVEGKATIDLFSDDKVRNQQPEIQQLINQIEIKTRDDLSEQQAEIVVNMNDSRQYKAFTVMAKGNPANPVSNKELEEKFHSLTDSFFNSKTKKVLEQIWEFDKMEDAAQIISLIKQLSTKQ